ncbi:MAG: RNA polymerase sigma factor [Vicinamibacterales bacterium]
MSREQRFQFDRAYIDRLTAGDPDTEQHFTRYFGQLLTIKLRSRLRSPALIEDARQETFARVLLTLRRKGGVTSAEGFGAFVNSVCNNVLFEAYRSEGRVTPLDEDNHAEPADPAGSAEESVLEDESRARVHRALATLPQRERDLIRWLFFEERDKDEICAELNVDRNYLRVLLHRAKARFRASLASGDETPGV